MRRILLGGLGMLLALAGSGCPAAAPTGAGLKGSPKIGATPRVARSASPTPSPAASSVASTIPGQSASPTPTAPAPTATSTATPPAGSPSATPSAGTTPTPTPEGTSGPTPVPTTETLQVSTFAGGASGLAEGQGDTARFNSPNGIDTDAAGNVYVADAGNHRIRKITPEGLVSTFAGSAAGFLDGAAGEAHFTSPYGVAVGPDGTVFVADTGNHRIRRVGLDGQVTTVAGGTEGFAEGSGTAAQFRSPFSLAADEAGNLYVADAGNHAIRKVSLSGAVTTVVGGTSGLVDGGFDQARFQVPNDVALNPARQLIVADFNNHGIRKLDLGLRQATTLAGGGAVGTADGTGAAARFNFPTGLAVDGQGRVYVADNQNHRIRIVDESGNVTTFAGGAVGYRDGALLQAQFNEPTDVAIDRMGRIYVADTQNHRIRRVQ